MNPNDAKTNPRTAKPGLFSTRFFYGWWMLGLISIMAAMNNAFFDKAPSLFLIPVGASLVLNRATVSLIFSLGYLGFVSLGATMAFQDSATAMVNMWFSRYRVRAMSIREATGNLGSTILIPLMTLVIAVWDWRVAAILGAAAYLVFILPLIPLLKESPESMGLLPDGADEDAVEKALVADADPDSPEIYRLRRFYDAAEFSVREALRTSSFWYLLIGTMLRQVSRVGIDLHYVAILEWNGFDISIAALFFTLRLGMNVPSKLVVGYFGDRVSKPAILTSGMILYAVGLVLLLSFDAVWILVVSAIVSGLSE